MYRSCTRRLGNLESEWSSSLVGGVGEGKTEPGFLYRAFVEASHLISLPKSWQGTASCPLSIEGGRLVSRWGSVPGGRMEQSFTDLSCQVNYG